MGRFNLYFLNDFRGCRLLANAYDNCRGRDVRIYAVPGEVDCVGVTDGTDKWIAPALDTLFSVPVRQIMRDISDGKEVAVVHAAPSRRRVALTPQPRLRVRIDAVALTQKRRRVRI